MTTQHRPFGTWTCLLALLVSIVAFGPGCTSEVPSEAIAPESPAERTAPKPAQVAQAPEPAKAEPQVAAAPTQPDPKETTAPKPKAAEVPAAKPAEAAAEPAATKKPTEVVFPEMKLSDHQAAVRALFVQAHKQFKDKQYVPAIQTLRNLDQMPLSEKEEQALDMFLKRIDKALNPGGTSESTENNDSEPAKTENDDERN